MGRDRRFFANAGRQGEVVRKRGAREAAAQATGCRVGAAVPEARGDGRRGGRRVGEHRPGEQGQFGQPLAGLGGVDELAGRAEQLLGRQRQLLHGPAIGVAIARRAATARVAWPGAAAPGGAGRGWRRR
jgi:hypothetical protein